MPPGEELETVTSETSAVNQPTAGEQALAYHWETSRQKLQELAAMTDQIFSWQDNSNEQINFLTHLILHVQMMGMIFPEISERIAGIVRILDDFTSFGAQRFRLRSDFAAGRIEPYLQFVISTIEGTDFGLSEGLSYFGQHVDGYLENFAKICQEKYGERIQLLPQDVLVDFLNRKLMRELFTEQLADKQLVDGVIRDLLAITAPVS